MTTTNNFFIPIYDVRKHWCFLDQNNFWHKSVLVVVKNFNVKENFSFKCFCSKYTRPDCVCFDLGLICDRTDAPLQCHFLLLSLIIVLIKSVILSPAPPLQSWHDTAENAVPKQDQADENGHDEDSKAWSFEGFDTFNEFLHSLC